MTDAPRPNRSTLSSTLRRLRRLPMPTAADVAQQILTALQAHHDQGKRIVDLGPKNILLTLDGGRRTVQVVASNLQDGVNGDDTLAVAVMTYWMLTGKLPCRGRTFREVLANVSTGPTRPAAVALPTLPERLATAVDKALSHQPINRFPSASAFSSAIADGARMRRRVPTAPPPPPSEGTPSQVAAILQATEPTAPRKPAGATVRKTYTATGDNRVVNSGTMNASTVAAGKGSELATNLAAEIAKYDAAKEKS